jgi:hypothetical protein
VAGVMNIKSPPMLVSPADILKIRLPSKGNWNNREEVGKVPAAISKAFVKIRQVLF